MRAIDSAID